MTHRIGAVAQRSGVAASAIRYYEREGLLGEVMRDARGRVYGDAIFDRLALIALAKRAGFTLSEIRQFVGEPAGDAAPRARWRGPALRKLREVEARIAEAEESRRVLQRLADCACPSLEACTRSACA